MGSLLIRDAHSPDLPSVANMIAESFDRDLWPYMVYTQHGIGEFLRIAIDYPSSSSDKRLYVVSGQAEIGMQTELYGFAEFRIVDTQDAFLSYICVDREVRGRGIAKQLISHFLAEHPNVETLDLDVFDRSTIATAMYERMGFETVSTSSWVLRSMPKIPMSQHPVLTISGLPISLAAHRVFGFSELTMRKDDSAVRLGRLGSETIRCFDIDTFQDDRLLSPLQSIFPETSTAFSIVPDASFEKLSVNCEVITRSQRMSLHLKR